MKGRSEHTTSGLLSTEENSIVGSLVGSRSQALATTVVQVYHSEGPGHSYRWNKRSCGVVCFIKDNLKRSYFIRVFDLDHNLLVFEQEIYNQFKYKTPRPYFHTFEGDDAQIGLNFADEKEAEMFQATVESKLYERRLRRERRQSSKKQLVHVNSSNGSRPANGVERVATAYTSNAPPYKKESAGKRVEKKKLKKEDIGMPTNFQHISHVGWDPNHGFDLENVDPNLKKFFQKAGVDEKALQDKDTRDFIYDFIDKHGGVEAALREVNSIPEHLAPPPPPRLISNPNSTLSRPTSNPVPNQAPPPPPAHPISRSASSVMRAPPPAPPAPPSLSIPPSPPPPPPAAVAPPPPPVSAPAPPPPPSLPPVKDSHTNLMEQIRKGGTLRHVTAEKTVKPAVDGRGELMGQIRQGVALKKVEVDNNSNGDEAEVVGSGIAGMLQRALQERTVVMGISSSEESEGEDDDEWD